MKGNIVTALSRTIILIAVFFIGVYVGGLEKESSTVTEDTVEMIEGEESVSIMIDYGNGTLNTFSDIAVTSTSSVFDILDTVTRENDIEFVYKDFGGELGVFVNSIGGVGQGTEDAWWQYWVNNEYGEVGVSSFVVEPEDVIEIKFIKGQL